jgi:hypothetical protein
MAEQLDLLAPAWEMAIVHLAPAEARRDLHLRVSVTAIGPTDQIDRETVPVIGQTGPTDPAMDQEIDPTDQIDREMVPVIDPTDQIDREMDQEIDPTDRIDREMVPVTDPTDLAMDQAIGPTVRATGIDPIGPTIPITPVESGEAGIAPTGNTKITGTETGMFKTIFGTIGT